MVIALLSFLWLIAWIHAVASKQGNDDARISKYSANYDERVLNVHIVPHSHDDVGWLKTVDQYYYGWNETIQVANVQQILDSVVEALLEDSSRTFVYVETKFFSMWWKDQSDVTKNNVKRLIHETKQLSFANGGWCMHDEATTHFMGMIDQTTLGHDFLKRELGVIPKIGWQLDPFGHSATQASLLTYQVGFDALYFGRVDYQDRKIRRATRECEGLWNANGNQNSQEDIEDKNIFWGLTGSYNGQYGPPKGICLDPNCDADDYTPLIEMNSTARMNVVKKFLLNLKQQSDQTKGNHIMVTMGEDFRYQKAMVNFANLDSVLTTISRMQQEDDDSAIDIASIFPEYDTIHVFYSSPEYYTQCKYNETIRPEKQENNRQKNVTLAFSRTLQMRFETNSSAESQWSVKHDDFFPYSDCPHCFWTGYYTSRPTLKRFERLGSSFLMAVRQLEALSLPKNAKNLRTRVLENHENESLGCGSNAMHELEDAMGILQHHDGVSGTSKQHVAYDYAKRLQAGIDGVLPCTIQKLQNAFGLDKAVGNFQYCQLLNETKCEGSVNATKSNQQNLDLYVIVYNSLASKRSVVVDLPVGSNGTFLVEAWEEKDSNNTRKTTLVKAQPSFFPPIARNDYKSNTQEDDIWILSFMATSLPPVGAKIFRIRKQFDFDGNSVQRNTKKEYGPRLRKVSNGRISLFVDTQTGDIGRGGSKGIESLSSWGYYTSFDSKKESLSSKEKPQNSGAYVFRPSTPTQKLIKIATKLSLVVETSLGTEIYTEYQEPWIKTVTKLRTGMPYLEIEYQVGPIPINDGIGKEVVTRYNTMVDNQGIFYTDSNGREFLRRKRNYRPTWNLTVHEPIAGNYYPINTAIYVDEATTQNNLSSTRSPAAFAIVTDRSQGGGSIVNGTVELMVHRRTLADDDRGVNEPINETNSGIEPCSPYGNATRLGKGIIIRGKHRILIENNKLDTSPKCSSNEPTCGGIGGARLARSLMDESFAEPLVFVGTARSSEEMHFHTKAFSGIATPLPLNVMLITKKPLYDSPNTYLIRLGHQFARGEDPEYSRPVDLNLSHLFPNNTILEFHETTLSGNRGIEEWKINRLDWTKSAMGCNSCKSATKSKERSTIITMTAMDIKTFIVKLAK